MQNQIQALPVRHLRQLHRQAELSVVHPKPNQNLDVHVFHHLQLHLLPEEHRQVRLPNQRMDGTVCWTPPLRPEQLGCSEWIGWKSPPPFHRQPEVQPAFPMRACLREERMPVPMTR